MRPDVSHIGLAVDTADGGSCRCCSSSICFTGSVLTTCLPRFCFIATAVRRSHSSCISYNLFQSRLTEKKFRHPQHLHRFMLKFRCSTTSSHIQKFKFLASSIVQASMASSIRRGARQCVFSAEHIAEVQAGTLPLNSGMPEVLQDLHGLLRTWSVRLHRRPVWNTSFLSVGCSIMDDESTTLYVQVSRDERL